MQKDYLENQHEISQYLKSYLNFHSIKPKTYASNKKTLTLRFADYDIQVVRSVSRALDKEALRVVGKMSKKWTPGRKDGKPMRVRYTLPIQFRLK